MQWTYLNLLTQTSSQSPDNFECVFKKGGTYGHANELVKLFKRNSIYATKPEQFLFFMRFWPILGQLDRSWQNPVRLGVVHADLSDNSGAILSKHATLTPRDYTQRRMESVNFLVGGGVALLRHSWIDALSFRGTQRF